MKNVSTITLSVMFSILIFVGTQAALADPGVDIFFPNNPNKKIGLGGTIKAEVGALIPEQNNVVSTRIAHALDSVGDDITFPGSTAACTSAADATDLPTPGFDGAEEQSVLVDGANFALSPLSLVFPGNTGTRQSATLNVGPTGAADIVASTTGAPEFYEATGGGPGDTPDGNRVFRGVVGAITGSSGVPNAVIGTGNYVISCGCIDSNTNKRCDTGETVSNDQDSYEVAKPVGGKIIDISTTALLLGSITSNSLWVLSALAAVGGTAFALLNFQICRKNQ